jgi:hypothetical protein
MDPKDQPSSVAQVLQNLDVILVGVGTPFAVQTFIQDKSVQGLFIGLGYFFVLVNFFHAKFNLTLADEFDAFSRQVGMFLNFVNLTLRILLSGSFVFMAFYLAKPQEFIIVNLCMRSCDLTMDVILLLRIHRLNLDAKIQKDLTHVHWYWLTGTLIFFAFFIGSLVALNRNILSPAIFGISFFVMAVVDTCFDYYWNRDFYFKPIRHLLLERIVNNRSWQYLQTNKILGHLPVNMREVARHELLDAVNESAVRPSQSNAWCAVRGQTVVGATVASTLPESQTVALRYLSALETKQWIQLAAYIARQVLANQIVLNSSTSDIFVLPTAVIVNAPLLSRQAPSDIRNNFSAVLSGLGFKESAANKDFWFLASHISEEISVSKQALFIQEWEA